MNPEDVGAQLEAWRASGAHRADLVRFRLIEAMARRAAAHQGAARLRLDARLDALLAAYAGQLAQTEPGATAPTPTPAAGALAALVTHIAQHTTTDTHAPSLAGAPELKTLGYFRSTWTRLNADRQLTQSLAKVPENAGPLNSHNLVHRSLLLMRELSPAYLHRLMGYVDTLMWAEQAQASIAAAPAETPRAPAARKTARSKAR
ncbi:DUF2894 domain-containing protein [Variovorax boronicumulans]|uniref:DUF2894 domain-containing protein n=1 Tax=Variovorax boronicumulans TaxID=436515 RepID=UPI001C59FB36